VTREEIAAFFVKRQHHWNARDADQLARDHAADGVVHSPMHGQPRGRDAIRASYALLFEAFPDLKFSGEDLIIEGDRVIQVFSADATHVGEFMGLMGTNRRFRVQGVRLCDMKDGAIQTERRLYDFTALLIQVGVLKPK